MLVAWNTAPDEAVKSGPRPRIRNVNLPDRWSRLKARLRACCTVHSPVGLAVTPPGCIRRVPCSMNTRTCSLFSVTVSACRKSAARIPAAWACRTCPQLGPGRRCRAGASSVQDLPDGGRRHGDAKLERLALDPAVAPQWILPRQAQHQPLDPRGSGRTAGPAPPARAVLLRGQPAVPGQERRRRDGEHPGPAPA